MPDTVYIVTQLEATLRVVCEGMYQKPVCKLLIPYNPVGACTSYDNPTLCLTLQTVRSADNMVEYYIYL